MKSRLASIGGFAMGLSMFAATPPSTGVRERVGVSLVEVPVTILDSRARPVRGLGTSDFQVFDDGTEVKIESVDVNEFPTSATPAEPTPTSTPINPVARRRFVFLFDLSFVNAAELERSRQSARRFVDETLGPADLAAVAALSTRTVAEWIQDFTADRAVLSRAIDSLRGRNQFFRSNRAITADIDTSGGRAAQFTAEDIQMMRREGRDEDARNIDYLVKGLGAIGTALRVVDGRKEVVLFSHGFDAASDPLVLAKLDQALEELRRNDCVVHALDVAGIRSMSQRLARSDSGAADNEVLADVARTTGGQFLTNSNNFAEQLARVAEATSVVYVLSFRPTSTGHPGQRHRLEVRTSRPGATLFARPSYDEPRAP